MLRRAARFLRVTSDLAENFDALDQPDDEPEPCETIYAYEIVEKPGHMHLNTGRKPGGGFYPIATYRYCDPQPPDQDTMMNAKEWAAWCKWQANANPRPELNA